MADSTAINYDDYIKNNSQISTLVNGHPDWANNLRTQLSNFGSQFNNSVGRGPTQGEVDLFTSNYLLPNAHAINYDSASPQNANAQSYISQFIGNNYQKAAQDYATDQLNQQKGQYQTLADQSRTMGNTSIDATQQSLLDYQSKLFDRLRPNLLTSLKAQGLLDSGALNEATAGVQGDLANNASQYIAGLRLQNEQNANQISLTGASNPVQYQTGTISGQPSYLAGVGSNATNFNNNTFMSNLDYQHQLGLIQAQTNAQNSLQPSFMRTFGQGAAASLGSNFNIPSWISAMNGGKTTPPPSARRFKKDISKLTEEEENSLYDKLVEMPLNRWHYKDENNTARHLGVITDEALPELLTEDGEHLSTVDYLGVLTLALKVQHRRMVA